MEEANIIIDDSLAEREGLYKTWPSSVEMAFMQMKEYLMDLVEKETELDAQFKSNTTVKHYPNFMAHME